MKMHDFPICLTTEFDAKVLFGKDKRYLYQEVYQQNLMLKCFLEKPKKK